MIDERQEELASLYALDLLEGAELTEFEAALARDPELHRRVDELRAAAADLARLAPAAEPPLELKARVLASLARRPGRSVVAAPLRAAILPFPNLIPWAIAACLAVAGLWTARITWNLHAQNVLMRDQQNLAELQLRSVRDSMEAERILRQRQLADAQRELADARSEVNASRQQVALLERQVADAGEKLADATRQAAEAGRQIARLKDDGDLAKFKIATLASMLGNSPQALAVAIWNPMEQEGMLKVAKLPMPAAGKDYQLWVFDPQYAAPVSGGLVAMDPVTGEAHVMFRTDRPIKTAAKFAISLEQKGGMPEPHGPVVMLSE